MEEWVAYIESKGEQARKLGVKVRIS